MGQPLCSSIITLFFLCIVVQFNHTCPPTQNEENNPLHRPKKKETLAKVLGQIRSSSYKNGYEGSPFCIYYSDKIYINMLRVIGF